MSMRGRSSIESMQLPIRLRIIRRVKWMCRICLSICGFLLCSLLFYLYQHILKSPSILLTLKYFWCFVLCSIHHNLHENMSTQERRNIVYSLPWIHNLYIYIHILVLSANKIISYQNIAMCLASRDHSWENIYAVCWYSSSTNSWGASSKNRISFIDPFYFDNRCMYFAEIYLSEDIISAKFSFFVHIVK